jgi:hypothetical protein
MAELYTFDLPALSVDQGIVQFFKNFYHISDTFGLDENYVEQFEENATFIVAKKQSQGSDGT